MLKIARVDGARLNGGGCEIKGSAVELAGFEPATLCLQSRCATSCAIAP